MNQPMLHTTSAKDLVLATAALCGELSPQAASRLVPSQSYRYHVLEDLVKSKLLRPYRRDKVKGYRLTRQAKNRLAEQSPDRYAALFSGSVRTNGYASELPRRLRMHRLGESLAIMMLCGVRVFQDEKADLFGARTQPQNSQLPAFYLAREVQALGDAAIKIKNARMTGVLLAPQRFYLVYNTGSALMRWAPASELRARTLLSEFLGRRMAIPSYAGRTAEAILVGDSMELAPALLQSRGGGRRQLFYLDGTFAQMHYLPNTPQGNALLRLLMGSAAQSALHAALLDTLQPKAQPGNFAFDALDERGRPALFAWDFDLVRIQSFALGLGSRGLSGTVIAFDFQADALRRIFGNRVDVRALSFEKTRRLLEI